jgi:2-methylisocitrate lyase-like PEP mutase family enzyme
MNQKEKAELFCQLHHSGEMLVLPNIWDPLGASLMESLGYKAAATASASIAFTKGYDDGENVPFHELLLLLKRIAESVDVPVTADIESGYAASDAELRENIRLLIQTGIAGINIEDTDKKTNDLYPADIQCRRIRLIREVSGEAGIPLFVNARTDICVHGKTFAAPEAKLAEILKRGKAYKEAGADGFFPILLTREEDIKELVAGLNLPVNILTFPGIPELKTLEKLGVARVSLGPNLLKTAVRAMKELALQLKDLKGLPTITGNEITTDQLKNLINGNY